MTEQEEFEFRARAEAESRQKKQKNSGFDIVAQDATGLDNLLPAIGGNMYGTYLGMKQKALQALDAIDPLPQNLSGLVTGKRPTRAGEIEKDIAENRAAMEALTKTKMGMAGDFLGGVATTLPLALNPATATLRGAAAAGGAVGFLRPTLGDESSLENAAMGAGAGAAGQWVGNKLMGAMVGQRGASTATGGSATASSTGGRASASSTASGNVTARGSGGGFNYGSVGSDPSAGLTRSQAALVARNPEFRLTPGQASGSKALQQMEAKLESQPMTSGTFNAIKDQNQRLVNRRVAEAIGIRGTDAVDDVTLNAAHDRVDRIYSMVRRTGNREIDPDIFVNWLSDIDSKYTGMIGADGAGSVLDNPLVKRLYSYAQNGNASAEQLVDLSSQLGKAARNQMTGASGNRQLGMALADVKDIADDLVQQGLSGRSSKLFSQARGNYRNLVMLESRIGVVNPSTGNVSGGTLANVLQQKDKHGYLLGKNQSPMYDAARLAQAFKPVVGDSGTATRSVMPSPTDFVLSAPFNMVTRAYTSSPVVSLAARGGQIQRNGLFPAISPNSVKYLPQIGAGVGLNGGLLALPQ